MDSCRLKARVEDKVKVSLYYKLCNTKVRLKVRVQVTVLRLRQGAKSKSRLR